MKILIPTAKQMARDVKEGKARELSLETKSIIAEMAKKSIDELATIYKINKDKAKEEKLCWGDLKDKPKVFEAFYLFDGLMYRNIERDNFTEDDKKYIEENVFITTSLYGVINAYYPIARHRLDFLQKVSVGGSSLKKIWNSKFDEVVKDEDIIISLLSSEFEEVFSKKYRDKFIKIIFMEEKNGVLKTHSTISKKARGKFLTNLIKEKVSSLEEIKKISFDNYNYDEGLSEDKKIIFIAR